MVKRFKLVITGFSLLIIMTGLAMADPAAENVIKDIEGKVSTITSYRADITMKMDMMGQTITSEGKLSFKKPEMVRMEMKMDKPMPMTTLTVSDGTTSYQYVAEMKMVQKMNMKEIGPLPSGAGQNSCDLTKPFEAMVRDTIQYTGEEELDGKKMSVLEGAPSVPAGMDIPYKKFKLWLGKDDGLLRKISALDNEGKEVMSQELKNVELNPALSDDTFKFIPPEGVQVLDMTESVKAMMESMKSKPSEK